MRQQEYFQRYLLFLWVALSHAQLSTFITVSIPPNTYSVSVSQHGNGSSFSLATFRQASSIANNYFPFQAEAFSYRQSFVTYFHLINIPPNTTSINVPYCTLLSNSNCIFVQRTYQLNAFDTNKILFYTHTFASSNMSEYSVDVTNIVQSSSQISLTLGLGSANSRVRNRQVFVYYKSFGNVDEVRMR